MHARNGRISTSGLKSFGLKWGVLWGKIGEGVVQYWPLTNSFFLLGVLTSLPILVKIDQEMRPWECSQTDRYTDRQTDRLTDANRFYNLSHAICYSYGTDNYGSGAVCLAQKFVTKCLKEHEFNCGICSTAENCEKRNISIYTRSISVEFVLNHLASLLRQIWLDCPTPELQVPAIVSFLANSANTGYTLHSTV